MKILVAEDNSTYREMLRLLLEKWGYEAELVEDGSQAWAILEEADAPPIAILDWMMPGLTGVEVCRRVRELGARLPAYLLLLTGRDASEDVVRGLDAGADAYLGKPFQPEELRARIHAGIRVVELQAQLMEQNLKLQTALGQIKTLRGILPICMHCHRIRQDAGAWQGLEEYVHEHSNSSFSHGICPDCLAKRYPDLGERGA